MSLHWLQARRVYLTSLLAERKANLWLNKKSSIFYQVQKMENFKNVEKKCHPPQKSKLRQTLTGKTFYLKPNHENHYPTI